MRLEVVVGSIVLATSLYTLSNNAMMTHIGALNKVKCVAATGMI